MAFCRQNVQSLWDFCRQNAKLFLYDPLVAAITVIREIENQSIALNPTKRDIDEFIKNIDSLIGEFNASFVFLGLDKGEFFFCYHHIEKIDHPVLQSLWCAGSGKEDIVSMLRTCFQSPIGVEGQPNNLALTASLIMALAGAHLQMELHDGGGLLSYFGGGYEFVTCINGRLQKFDDITYVFWEAQLDEKGEIKLTLPQKIIKDKYLDNYLIIRSVSLINGKSEDESLNLISPVHDVFPVFPFFHPSLVNDFVSILNESDLFDVEARVTPPHEFTDQFVCDLSLLLQEFENLRPKQVFKRFEICLTHHMKCPGVSKKSVGNNGMQVGMKPLLEFPIVHILKRLATTTEDLPQG